jgi:molybdopterin/thiamine biosynthesis adenylyltransferase/rhodanese-related sulfurtransferase
MSESFEMPVETSVEDAAGVFCPSRPLIDIRTAEESQLGFPTGAVSMSPEELLQRCRKNRGGGIQGGFVICAEGVRSQAVVLQLREMGIDGFSSVAGGFQAWASAGLPVGYPAGLDASQADRYARHLVMPQVGSQGQRKLLDSRILLVGLGGLNSPVALYLAAAGVGTLGLADFDTVERSNLQRQIVHGESRLGTPKATSARDRISDLNPDIDTVVYNRQVTAGNAGALLESWDIVVDGTDSFSSRYALNDACVRQSKPLVYGAVMRFQGQVSVFWPGSNSLDAAPCFRCMVPQEPDARDAPGCTEAGVLGVLPGIVGTLQANEALKLALEIGQPLIGKLLMIDALNMEFRKMRIPANPECPSCSL